MGNQAFRTEHALDRKPDQDRIKLNGTLVMSITDEAAFLSTGTLDPMELQAVYRAVIIILRKIIVSFKNNCYHTFVSAQRGVVLPQCRLWGKTGRLCMVVACLFSMEYHSSIMYETMITEKASASNNLTE